MEGAATFVDSGVRTRSSEAVQEVPLLDLRAQLETTGEAVKKAVCAVIDSGRYILGSYVEALEERVRAYVGARHAVGVSSGTDALLMALMAVGVGPGDVVLTSPYSFFATAGAIVRLGATPAFVDIDPDTYNLDPAALNHWLGGSDERRHRVKAILPVHLYGQCADMDAILDVAARHDLPVIEDAAQAMGARYPRKDGLSQAGSMGLLACFSFFPSKNLGGIGDGGMVVASQEGLDDTLRRLRNHGAGPKYFHAIVGGNFRLDAIQAAALLAKFDHLDAWHARRQQNAAYYDAHLRCDAVRLPAIAYGRSCHIYNQYVISVRERRDDLRAHLTRNRIGNEVYYPVPFHLQECFQHLGYRRGDFPCSEYAAQHTLALPIYPELTEAMQDYVIETVLEFYR